MEQIKIQVSADRKVSKNLVNIGNMLESGVTKLVFELDEDIVALGGNVYLFVSYDGKTYPYPLADYTFEVGRELTQRKKNLANVVVSTSDDLKEPLKDVVWISNTITLKTDATSIDMDSINEKELPPSLEIVYDDLLALEERVQEKIDQMADYQSEGKESFATNKTCSAVGDYSFAGGKNATANGRGFYIKSIDLANKKIYLSHTKSSPSISSTDYTDSSFTTPLYQTGDKFNIINGNHYDLLASIVSVQNNVISYDGDLGFTELVTDDEPDGHTFSVPSRPNVGEVILTNNAISLSKNGIAFGECSIATGRDTIAAGNYSHAEGRGTIASYGAHAEGKNTQALGEQSHAEGVDCIAKGLYSHAEGRKCQANGYCSHASGFQNEANGHASFAEGENNHSNKMHSHTEGYGNETNGEQSHAEGRENVSGGHRAHSEGFRTQALGDNSHTEGDNTIANGDSSHAEGKQTKANGEFSHAEGCQNEANGHASHVEGDNCISTEWGSHAEGSSTTARAVASHAEGEASRASGRGSHTEGGNCKSTETYSHSEGYRAQANGVYSHSEGFNTKSTSTAGHAEGQETVAGYLSHAEGYKSKATAQSAHAEGEQNIASGNFQHVQGKFNIEDKLNKFAHIVGGGTTDTSRANIHTLDWQGNAWYSGTVASKGADYAEYFEWQDGNPDSEDRVGLLVTLDGEYIRLANKGDEILGAISGTAAILGDNYECEWNGKYVTDDYGRIVCDTVEEFIDAVVGVNEETNEPIIEKKSLGFFKHPKLNPEYNSDETYINRSERKEWDTVGMLGKLFVRDDGTCQVNGYVTVGRDGIATKSEDKTNMRVLSRVNEGIVRVLLK